MLSSSELHQRADELRTKAENSADLLWKVTLNTLAEEFDLEAAEQDRLTPRPRKARRA